MSRRGSGRGRGSSSSAAGRSRPGSVTPTSIRSVRASAGCAATSTASQGLDAYLEVIAAYAAAHPGRAVDPRRRLVDGGLPGRPPAPRRPRPRRPGPAGLPRERRRPHGLGQRPGARAGRHHRRQPRPGRRADRARPGRQPDRRAPGGRGVARRAAPAADRASTTWSPRCASPRPSSIASASPTGRTPSSNPTRGEAAYTTLAERGELTARVVGALWWDRERGAEQIEELVERRARTASDRYRPTSVKLMQDGVLENGTGAVLEPYLDAGRPPDEQPRAEHDRPRRARRATSHGSTRSGSRRTSTPSASAPSARRSTRSRSRARGQRPDGHAAAHRAHPGHPPRRHRPLRDARRDANAQALWASHHPQMDDLTIPFLGPERATWQYPFRSLLRAGARLAMGSDWASRAPNPLLEMEVAVTRIDAETARRPAAVPARRADRARRRARRLHLGECLGQPPRGRRRLDRGRQGGRPRRPRPRPVRSRGRAPSARRGSWRRSSTASPSTRRRARGLTPDMDG